MADDEPVHLDKQDARSGATLGVMRYVLGISLIAIVVIFALLLFLYR
jgi:hypothetical protein